MIWCSDVCKHLVFLFKQKTAYEMRISDWSSDVCSSDLAQWSWNKTFHSIRGALARAGIQRSACSAMTGIGRRPAVAVAILPHRGDDRPEGGAVDASGVRLFPCPRRAACPYPHHPNRTGSGALRRSEAHTSELQSLMRPSYT